MLELLAFHEPCFIIIRMKFFEPCCTFIWFMNPQILWHLKLSHFLIFISLFYFVNILGLTRTMSISSINCELTNTHLHTIFKSALLHCFETCQRFNRFLNLQILLHLIIFLTSHHIGDLGWPFKICWGLGFKNTKEVTLVGRWVKF